MSLRSNTKYTQNLVQVPREFHNFSSWNTQKKWMTEQAIHHVPIATVFRDNNLCHCPAILLEDGPV